MLKCQTLLFIYPSPANQDKSRLKFIFLIALIQIVDIGNEMTV